MRAVVFQGPGRVAAETVPDPDAPAAEAAVVRVALAAICGSDLHVVDGSVPAEPGIVLGHEAVGIVEAVGAGVERFRRGDRVVVPAVVGCGRCEPCRIGYSARCERFPVKVFGVTSALPGAQAEFLTVPSADYNLWPAPAGLGDEAAVCLSDVLPTGYYAAENAGVRPGATVAVLGCGPVGLAAAMAARLFGAAEVFAVDRVAARLERAEAAGARAVGAGPDAAAAIERATEGRGVDAVIEAVGTAETVRLAFELVRIGGTVSMVGVLVRDDLPFPMGTAFLKDVTFRVGLVSVHRLLPRLVRLVRTGRLDPAPLVTHRLPLGEAAHAYALFQRRAEDCLKIVLAPEGAAA